MIGQRKPLLGTAEINWAHPLASGLIGAWLFAEGGGGPHDLVGVAHGALNSAPLWQSSPAGLCLKFDLSAAYVDCGSSLPAASGDYAVAYRFIMDSDTDFQMTMTRAAGSGSDWEIGWASSKPYMGFDGGSQITTNTSLSLSTIYDVVFTTAGTVGKGYVNGVDDTATGSTAWRNGNGTVFFGKRSDGHFSAQRLIHAYVFQRNLAAADASRLAAEPYAFLRPKIARTYFFPARLMAPAGIVSAQTRVLARRVP